MNKANLFTPIWITLAVLLALAGCQPYTIETLSGKPISPLQTPVLDASAADFPTPTRWNWFPTATALARITATPLPPIPTPKPRITPTPPVSSNVIRSYNSLVPLRAEGITLAAVKPFDADRPMTFRSWSPDGSHFLFGRSEQRYILVQFKNGAAANGFGYDLWVANADGAKPRKLADLASDAIWSPNGLSVAYMAPMKAEGVEGKLYVVDISGSKSRQVADCDLGGLDDLAWLPTDEIICRHNGVMYAVRSDGSELRQLNTIFSSDFITNSQLGEILPPVFQGYYRISPNGKKVAYLKTGLPPTVWVSDLDGSNAVEIEGRLGSFPSWSPDSTRLAYSVYNGKGRLGTDLWIINANGSNARRIVAAGQEESECLEPTWSPDSKVVAYTYRPNDGTAPEAVWVVNEDGTNPRLLVDLAFAPRWSAKGNEIAVLRQRAIIDPPETLLVVVGLVSK